jgi:hypothetical protein
MKKEEMCNKRGKMGFGKGEEVLRELLLLCVFGNGPFNGSVSLNCWRNRM